MPPGGISPPTWLRNRFLMEATAVFRFRWRPSPLVTASRALCLGCDRPGDSLVSLFGSCPTVFWPFPPPPPTHPPTPPPTQPLEGRRKSTKKKKKEEDEEENGPSVLRGSTARPMPSRLRRRAGV